MKIILLSPHINYLNT